VLHNPAFPYYQSSMLRFFVVAGFFGGLVTLVPPMLYLRSVISGRSIWANLDAAPWQRVVSVRLVRKDKTPMCLISIELQGR